MDSKELRKLNTEDLDKKMKDVNLELVKLKSQASTGTAPKNPSQIKILKRTIARIKTIKNQQ